MRLVVWPPNPYAGKIDERRLNAFGLWNILDGLSVRFGKPYEECESMNNAVVLRMFEIAAARADVDFQIRELQRIKNPQ